MEGGPLWPRAFPALILEPPFLTSLSGPNLFHSAVEHWDLSQGSLPQGNLPELLPSPIFDQVPAPGRPYVPCFLTFPEEVLLP